MTNLRLCLIGNSHLAALKLGWKEIAGRHDGVNVTFFGSHKNSLNELEAHGRSLVSRSEAVQTNLKWTSGGKSSIDVDDYDVIVLYGLYSQRHFLQHAIAKGALNRGPAGWGKALLVSKDIDVARFVADETLAGSLQRMLRAFDKPVLVCPSPLPVEGILRHSKEEEAKFWRRLVGEDGNPVPPVAVLMEKWNEFSARPDVIAQRSSTIHNTLFTQGSMVTGAVRLSPDLNMQQPPDNYDHMNGMFGQQMMEDIVARCRIKLAGISTKLPEGGRMEQRNHPYVGLPSEAYWKHSVADRDGEAIAGWYRKKFDINDARVATAGSCFAQHIGRRLRTSGFSFVDVEPAPANMPANQHLENGYSMYSGRYGNLYTTRQLLQLFERAFGEFTPQEDIWETRGGFVDPFRPTIQPVPFQSRDELIASREAHFAAVRELFQTTDLFVFTLGLTETWMSKKDGAAFPIAPGVSGGHYDPSLHRMHNLSFADVINDFKAFIDKTRAIRGGIKYLLTVSPVPLMATASGRHVVSATTYSKSVLRAAAGQLEQNRKYVDYFPSFEIINSHVMGGRFYESDKRSVMERGVDHVMRQFFTEHVPPGPPQPSAGAGAEDEDRVLCDEALLAAFGDRSSAT